MTGEMGAEGEARATPHPPCQNTYGICDVQPECVTICRTREACLRLGASLDESHQGVEPGRTLERDLDGC